MNDEVIRVRVKTLCNKYINAWKNKDYNKMYLLSTMTFKSKYSTIPVSYYDEIKMHNYSLKKIEKVSDYVYDAYYKCLLGIGGVKYKRYIVMRVVLENSAYKPHIDGRPGVSPISCIFPFDNITDAKERKSKWNNTI